ncbi:MAG: hypothetical protein ACE5DR_03125 [Thermodesulfobacteriota bacterium]
MKKIAAILFVLSLFFVFADIVRADSLDDMRKRYPSDAYMVGVAEVDSSGDAYKDRRRAEILARLEIAKHIRVKIKETTVDVMCEGKGRVLYVSISECRNQFVMIVEETVDEVLVGSRIAEAGEDRARGVYYAVALLPLKEAATKARRGYRETMTRAKGYVDRAKSAKAALEKKTLLEKSKKELAKGLAYEGERQAVEKTKQNADDMFNELTGEIKKVEEGI